MVLRFGTRLQRRGFHVLMPDFRAHGETAGGTRTFGVREADDVLAAVEWLRGHEGIDPGAVGVVGFSMGAVAALYAAARDPRIAAVVADSPFADLSDVVERRFRQQPLARMLMPVITRIGARFAGVPLAEIAPRRVVAAIGSRPVLLIHGDADALTPVDHSRELFALLSGPKELWITEGAGHVETSSVDPDAYLERVAGFLDRHLRVKMPTFEGATGAG
jgi:dipeptidyl aminopeptidase/acylaminoacyl peptidase